jgi:hypothetical protein
MNSKGGLRTFRGQPRATARNRAGDDITDLGFQIWDLRPEICD